jgi:hypothetical protein
MASVLPAVLILLGMVTPLPVLEILVRCLEVTVACLMLLLRLELPLLLELELELELGLSPPPSFPTPPCFQTLPCLFPFLPYPLVLALPLARLCC